MSGILLTKDTGKILGPIARLLGYIMNGIFYVIDKIGIPNVGLAIILFTIVIYLLLMPLTIKQQKYSKLSAKMNPELQAIQKKYKDKKDNDSMMAMNMETKAVYAKYGVSPSGSCVQLLIQMPILLALYRVINNIPAYVEKIYYTFGVLADKIIAKDNALLFRDFDNIIAEDNVLFLRDSEIKSISSVINMYGKNITESNINNGVIDVLNKLSTSDLQSIAKYYDLSNLKYNGELIISEINTAGEIVKRGLIDRYNYFLGINIGNSPKFMVSEALHNEAGIQWIMVIMAFVIPVLAAVTQWINVKLMPQQEMTSDNEQQNTMMQSMKTMNMVMPIMSAVFCYGLPAGMGLYWVAGAVVRSIQQIVINKYIDKMDLDEVIKKNADKAKKKMEKANVQAERMAAYANMNTKKAGVASKASIQTLSKEEKEELVKKSTESYSKSAKPGSMMAKANMVKEYNEKKSK